MISSGSITKSAPLTHDGRLLFAEKGRFAVQKQVGSIHGSIIRPQKISFYTMYLRGTSYNK